MTAPDAKAAREVECKTAWCPDERKYGGIHMKPDSPAPRCHRGCGWIPTEYVHVTDCPNRNRVAPPAESPVPQCSKCGGEHKRSSHTDPPVESPTAGEGLIERVHALGCGCAWTPNPACLSLRAAHRRAVDASRREGRESAAKEAFERSPQRPSAVSGTTTQQDFARLANWIAIEYMEFQAWLEQRLSELASGGK